MAIGKLFYLREVLKNAKTSAKTLNSIQKNKLIDIIRYSYKNVPYYKKSWSKLHIDINSVSTVEDLKKLPAISKQTVSNNYNDFISSGHTKYLSGLYNKLSFLHMRSTSGTSGNPLKIFFNPDAKEYQDAIYARSLLSIGYNPFKPLIYYWYWSQEKPQGSLYHLLGLFKKFYVTQELDEEAQLNFMQKARPEYLYYYPSALYFISRLIVHENLRLNFKPKFIITFAEILTETMRKAIENAFDSRVYDQYATNEFNVVSYECEEKNGYHANSDSVVVEIVDENYEEVDDGEIGRILITGLANKAMPLIRYDIGDLAVKTDGDRHSCGISLPVIIKSIEGRYEHSEIKKTAETQKALLEKFMKTLDEVNDMFKFQILLTGTRRAKINYTAFHDLSNIDSSDFKNIVKNYVTSLKRVGSIGRNKYTGKTLLLEKAY